MPCFGPSDAECREMDRDSNWKRFGVEWDNEQLAGNVACAACTLLTAEQIKQLPVWAQLWWQEHQERDRKEKKRQKREQVLRELKEKALNKLTPEERKALGL